MSNTTGQNGYYPRIRKVIVNLRRYYWIVIYSEDVEHIFGKRAWISRSQEILELQEKANGKNKENADKEAEADATMENVTDTPTEENKTGKIA